MNYQNVNIERESILAESKRNARYIMLGCFITGMFAMCLLQVFSLIFFGV